MTLPAHVVVVGGTRGTGRVISDQLAARGVRVTVLGRTPPADAAHPHVAVDLCSEASVDGAIAHLRNDPPDGVVFAQRYRGDGDSWAGELAASLSATRQLIEAWSGPMADAGRGAIVVLTSIAGELVADEQPIGYHAAKGALQQMIRYYAVVLGPHGVRVNGVAPSSILKPEGEAAYRADASRAALDRQVVPLGRIGTAAEVGAAARFLLSSDASFVTGQILTVDGGVSLVAQESLGRKLAGNDAAVDKGPIRK